MIVYISLPISGHDEAIQRQKAYNMELKLKEKGHIVINPFTLGDEARRIEGRDLSWGEYMVIDLFHLKNFADAIVFMKGWPNSRGCMDECDCAIKHEKILLLEEMIWTK